MSEWYESWFGRDYLLLYAHRSEEEARRQVDFLRGLFGDLPQGARMLDLGCGAGRHAVALAASGFRVTGADLSPELLVEARQLAGRRGVSLSLVRCDMRHLPFGPVFQLALSLFTSFGYFPDDADNARVLAAIASALPPGGCFVLDYLNPARVRNGLEPESRRPLPGGGTARERRWVDEKAGRVEKEIVISPPAGEERRYRESVRLYPRAELERMLAGAGLAVDEVHGDFAPGARFDPGCSPRMIFTGRRR